MAVVGYLDVPIYLARNYQQAAQRVEVKHAAHLELISSYSSAWPIINKAI
jgi:hypothetical protein